MLKKVGASGQISLGNKFAGRLFDVIVPHRQSAAIMAETSIEYMLRSYLTHAS